MASKLDVPPNDLSSAPIVERVNAIRDRWHTKRHPFFHEFSEGRGVVAAAGLENCDRGDARCLMKLATLLTHASRRCVRSDAPQR